MEQERGDLSGTVGMGGPSGDSTVAHLPLPRPAISRLEPAPDQGGPASAQAHRIALSSVARDWAHFGLRTPPRSRPGCHGDAALPAASSLWVPQSPRPGVWGCGRRAAGAPLGPGWRGDTTLGQRRRGWGASSARIGIPSALSEFETLHGKPSPWGSLPDSRCSALPV